MLIDNLVNDLIHNFVQKANEFVHTENSEKAITLSLGVSRTVAGLIGLGYSFVAIVQVDNNNGFYLTFSLLVFSRGISNLMDYYSIQNRHNSPLYLQTLANGSEE